VYIVLLGAPGAGKGTQAANVARELGLTAIATGDLFRQAVERGDELGLKVKNYIEKGALVPDEITAQVVLERMSSPDCRGGVVFDGFPRNLKQAEVLDEALRQQNKNIDWVVYIKVPKKELIRRLNERLVCRQCQTPYGKEDNTTEDKCHKCGGELYQRPDDNIETVKERLKVYFNKTAPLIEYYKKSSKLLEVDGEGSVDKVTRRITDILREREYITG
jgi:adenylate kinase